MRDLPWRAERDPWRILVSEVMLQQTQVERVIPKWNAFLAAFPTPADCATASLGDVLRLWQGLGYPRRARNLQAAAVVVVDLHGGLSQLESWDPKPGTDTGGPFRAIPTSVPGIHISELLPHTAKQMHHLSLVRSINIKETDHSRGRHKMLTGYKKTPAGTYPELGAVVAKGLDDGSNSLPGHVKVYASGSGARSADSAYLGPKYGSTSIGGGKDPANSERPRSIKDVAEAQRNLLRQRPNERFLNRRRTAQTDA